MKTFVFLFLLAAGAYAQNEVDIRLQEAKALFDAGNYTAALKSYRDATAMYSDGSAAMSGQGACLLALGNYAEARKALTQGSWFDPINPTPLKSLAQLEIIEKGDLEAAKKWITRSVRLFDREEDFAQLIHEIDAEANRSAQFTALKAFAESEFNKMQRGKEMAAIFANFSTGERFAGEGKTKEAIASLDKFFNEVKRVYATPHGMIMQTYVAAAGIAHSGGEFESAFRYMREAYNYYFSTNADSPFFLGRLVIMLCDYYNAYGQYENMIGAAEKALQVSSVVPSQTLRGELLVQFLKGKGFDPETRPFSARQGEIELSKELLSIAPYVPERKTYYEAFGYNFMGVVYILSEGNQYRQLAKENLEASLRIAQANNIEGMINSSLSNLALVYFREKNYAKAHATYRELIDKEKKEGNVNSAILSLSNLGSLYWFNGQFADAAQVFEESVKLAEESRAMIPPETRASFIRSQISAYQFLNICYARLGQSDKLFTSIERSRSRALAENISMGRGLSSVSLAEVQASLAANEAVIMYAMAEQSEFVMLVITSTQALPLYRKDPEFIPRLQNKFAQGYGVAMKLRASESTSVDPFRLETADKTGEVVSVLRFMMTKAPGTEIYNALGAELQKEFYNLLITPAEPLLAGKNKIYLSPDSYLSFIPFDALRDAQGKYVAEKFEVHYAPSMTVMKMLNGRKYSSARKPMIAFGGATFAPYTAKGMVIESEQDFRQLQMKVVQNAREHRSQRENLASIGVQGSGWKYLPGTMTEVSEVAKRVAGVDVITGAAFDEGNIKAMSARGDLAKYRAVHFATHGMVVPTFPELSTVVTTLALTEKGGEDGFLTVPEAKELKLQADFVALSACETGLGKLYAGEGVIGLTQSFLEAGANAMSVSLWAISDDATMQFMIGLYDLVYNQKKPFATAMMEIKRKFIRGDFGAQYQDPYFWAPFAYYGE